MIRLSGRAANLLTLLGPYFGLFLVFVIFATATWWRGNPEAFVSIYNLQTIAVQASVLATVALGMTLIMISGGIDLSVGFVVSLVTVTTVLAYRATGSSAAAIGCGIATGGIIGFLNGTIITKLRIVPFVATLGMMGIARGLARYISEEKPVLFPDDSPAPDWVPWLGKVLPEPAWLLVSPAAWSVVVLAIVAAVLLKYTVLGRHCYAIGSNEATARLCGIAVDRTKILLYTLAGLVTGWAGIIQTARIGRGDFDVKAGLELEVIAAVVIGGASLSGGEGTISGTLVGVLMLAVLDNGCTAVGLSNEYRFIVIGFIIVGVAALNTWRSRKA